MLRLRSTTRTNGRRNRLGRPRRLEFDDVDVAPLLGHAEVVAGGIEQKRAVGTLHLELNRDPRERLFAGPGHDHLHVFGARFAG